MSSHAQTGQNPAAAGVGSDAQRRVDAIVAEAKAGLRRPDPLPASPPISFDLCPDVIDARLAEEVDYVRGLLDAIGEQFASDAGVLQRHARTMQGFDLAGQILGHIAKVLAAEDRGAAIDSIGMHELRTRLKRQPL